MKPKCQPTPEPVISPNEAPLPIRETQWWVMLTTSECLALVDGVIPESVKAKAGLVDRPSQVPGMLPYAVMSFEKG